MCVRKGDFSYPTSTYKMTELNYINLNASALKVMGVFVGTFVYKFIP